MPPPEKKENQSAIKKVIGASKEREEEIKAQFAERFSKQDIPELKKLEIKEIEKTPKQLEIIKYVVELTNEASKKYGGQELKIPSDNVHILKGKDYEKFYEFNNRILNKNSICHYARNYQAVFLKEDSSLLNSALILIERTLHENIHFQSYQTERYRYVKDRSESHFQQMGIKVAGKTPETKYFRNLNESVTEELTKRVMNKEILNKEVLQTKNPKLFELLKKEIETLEVSRKNVLELNTKDIQLYLDPSDILVYRTESEGGFMFKLYSYSQKREILNNLIEKLYSKNKEKFKDKEEVFDLFAGSLFTGKLRWVRLVNETFGAGTLQKLAKADKNVGELGEFVDGLKV